MFQKASKKRAKLRLALMGPAGSGKTWSAIAIAKGLGSRIAVVDTENGSASKYAGDLADFDVVELTSFEPERYIEAIAAAESGGYDVVILDSLSHAWAGKGGLLESVDKAARASKSGNGFSAWRDATPRQMALVEAMLRARVHVIATMRTKTEYVQERDERGRSQIRKIGLQPVQRDGLEYEFDVVGDIDAEHNLVVTKSRCSAIAGEVIAKPGEKLGATLLAWLSDGAEEPPPPPPPPPPNYLDTPEGPSLDAVHTVLAACDGATSDGEVRALHAAWKKTLETPEGKAIGPETRKGIKLWFVRALMRQGVTVDPFSEEDETRLDVLASSWSRAVMETDAVEREDSKPNEAAPLEGEVLS